MRKKFEQKSSPASPFNLGETMDEKYRNAKSKRHGISGRGNMQPPYAAGTMTHGPASRKVAKEKAAKKMSKKKRSKKY